MTDLLKWAAKRRLRKGREKDKTEEANADAISDFGVEVLGDREGCKLEAYQDDQGYWTIGYGHSELAGSPPVPCDGMVITEETALAIFDADLDTFEQGVRDAVTAPMLQREFDAFVSICFNIGISGFSGSTFVQLFNDMADPNDIAAAIDMWHKPTSIISRRNGEHVQFLGYVARIDAI